MSYEFIGDVKPVAVMEGEEGGREEERVHLGELIFSKEVDGVSVRVYRQRVKCLLEISGGGETLLKEVEDAKTVGEALEALRERLAFLFIEKGGLESAEDIVREVSSLLAKEVGGRVKVFTERGVLTLFASDGFILRPSVFHVNVGGKEYIGELTYAYGSYRQEEGEGKKRKARVKEGIFPILVLSGSDGKRSVAPLLGRVIFIDGLPIQVEFKARLAKPLPTLMRYESILRFLNGERGDMREVYPRLLSRMAKFIDVSWDVRLIHVLACYAVATYFTPIFSTFPILVLTAPYGSGKTRTGMAVTFASRRGLVVTSPTEAALFRTAEALGCTLFIDDKEGNASRLLHLAYKKGVRVPRAEKEGETFTLNLYELFTPIIISTVEEIPAVQLTRAITVVMKWRPDPNPEGRDPMESDFADLREEMYLAELTQFHEVKRVYEQLSKERRQYGLESRDWEVWGPLLTVAKIIGEDVFNAVLSYALENIEEKREELYVEEKELLAGLEEVIFSSFSSSLGQEEEGQARKELEEKGVLFTSADVYRKMRELLVRKEGEEEEEKPYTPKQFDRKWSERRVATLLAIRLGIKTAKVVKGKRYKVITLKQFKELAERFRYEYQREQVRKFVEQIEGGCKGATYVSDQVAPRCTPGRPPEEEITTGRNLPVDHGKTEGARVQPFDGNILCGGTQKEIININNANQFENTTPLISQKGCTLAPQPSHGKTDKINSIDSNINEQSLNLKQPSGRVQPFNEGATYVSDQVAPLHPEKKSDAFSFGECYLLLAAEVKSRPSTEAELLELARREGFNEEVARKCLEFMVRVGKARLEEREGRVVYVWS